MKTDFGSMRSDIRNLKEKMETSNAEKILTIGDETSFVTCKNCKSNPCLKDSQITQTNFVDGAH